MATLVAISPACEADVPSIAPIMGLAMRDDLIDTFMFGFERPEGIPEKTFFPILSDNLKNPKYHVFKATLRETGEIVGYGIIRNEDGVMEIDDPPWSAPPPVVGPPGSSPDFRGMYRGAIQAKWKEYMRGKEHVVWDSLFVKPQHQRRGIATEMLRYGFAEFDLEKNLIWLSTQMRGRDFYRKYGWENVDNVDIDLSEWGGKYCGFGIHRSPLMLRQPGKFKKI